MLKTGPAVLGARHVRAGVRLAPPSQRLRLLTVRSSEDVATTEADQPETPASLAPISQEYTLIGPDPSRFSVSEGQLINVASAAFPGLMRLGMGGFAYGYRSGVEASDASYAVLKGMGRKVVEKSDVAQLQRPAQPIILYEFEGCPFCKKVREAVSVLDLDCLFYPCPRDGPTFRPQALAKGGKAMFPYLEDPNTGTAMYESDDIIKYLYNTYGPGEAAIPRMLRLGILTAITAGVGLLPRGGKGSKYMPARMPEKPIIYWGYELSPFCKIVREKLVELELPHLQISCARGSPKRQQLFEKRGHFQVPYIEDPNTGYAMFESAAIIRYLEQEYAVTDA